MKNLKKVIALVAVFAMLVSTVAFAQSYTDVKDGDNYAEAIEMLSSLNILTGDKDDNGNAVFRPNDTITRAEVAAIVERMQNINAAANSATVFTDVPSSHWASGYIAQATAAGIINGYGDGTFGPEDDVLYEQVIKMVVEAIGYAPFVKDNGGYYAGHLLAAQRYGVLDGVVGGAIGAKATRGQVAQLVYNAIDTPLMDRYTYGDKAEYVIYHGKNGNDFETLLTRDLGVVKGTGIVSANAVTSLVSYNDINTDKDEVIKIDFNDDDDYYNYELEKVHTVYANGTNAGASIGKEVTFYLKETSKSGEYDVLSVAETNKNKEITVSLDNYSSYDGAYFKYYKDDNARSTTDVKVAIDSVLYNGVAYSTAVTDVQDLLDSPTWSGQITLIDNGEGSTYNVMSVEIAAAAVVDEVSGNGKVSFKNSPSGKDGKKIELIFDEDDETQIIELTKNGEAYDYTQLTEWDVLSVLANDKNDYYVAEVIDAGKISSTISEVGSSDSSADDKEYKIDGQFYDVAENAELNGRLTGGASGVFYIDKYGKIVAYDKNGSTTGSDAYAYILNAVATADDFGKQNIRVQYLDKTGAIGDVYFSTTVTIENAGTTLATALGIDNVKDTVKVENFTATKADALAEALKNKLVTYGLSGNYIKTITFAQDDPDDGSLCLNREGKDAAYDEDNQRIKVGGKNYDLDDSTIVFFINGSSDVYVDGSGLVGDASKTASKVGTVAALADDYDYAQVYDDDDTVGVLVLFNTSGGISGSSKVAIIDSIGEATVDGTKVTSVTYWMNGVKATAYTDVDYTVNGTDIADAEQGDAWKLAVNGTTITEARRVAGYSRYKYVDDSGEIYEEFKPGEDGKVELTDKNFSGKEGYEFGPVVGYTSVGKKIQYAPALEEGGYDFTKGNSKSVKVGEDVNVYVVDPARRSNNVYVGAASDVSYDKDLIEQANSSTLEVWNRATTPKKLVSAGKDALGMMDFVLAITYDDDVQDVIIYKANDFGKYNVKEVPAEEE